MCASFAVYGIPLIYRLHVYIDLSLDPSGILIDIGLLSGCKLFNGVTCRKKCLISPASAIASLFVIFMIVLEYAVSILLGVRLSMIVVLSSYSSSSAVASRATILLLLR